jgi:hypothetical protein
MKQNKMYEAPKVELIQMEAQGVLCASGEQPASTQFNGTTMEFSRTSGIWNN